jgi:hypothetical protein
LVACKNRHTPAHSSGSQKSTNKKHTDKQPFKAYYLNKEYIVTDTGQYTNDGPMTGGSYAIIKLNGVVVDTIDLDFGMDKMGDKTYFYQKLSSENNSDIKPSPNLLSLVPVAYFVVNEGHKTKFSNLVADFDKNFSSPRVINGKVYYWQLQRLDTLDNFKVSAAEFDPATHLTKNFFLLNDAAETDDTNYFGGPYPQKNTIVFQMDEKRKWTFTNDFKKIF